MTLKLKEAKKQFLHNAPRIVDSWKFVPAYAGHHPARLTEWDGAEDATHTNKCPEHDHDCCREGCGKSWTDSYDYGAKLEVWHKNTWKLVGQWVNWERGYMGI